MHHTEVYRINAPAFLGALLLLLSAYSRSSHLYHTVKQAFRSDWNHEQKATDYETAAERGCFDIGIAAMHFTQF